MQKTLLALLGLSSGLIAAQNQDRCAPEQPTTCYTQGDCERCYCLGPDNIMANAPVCPRTCDGDISISVEGFYWNAHQDGMEYAIDNRVRNQITSAAKMSDNYAKDNGEFNNLIDAEYLTPDFKWNGGFKAALSYCSPCDGWDVGVSWTWYKGNASSDIEADADNNHVLLPLWSAFSWPPGGINFATAIETNWDLKLNLIDIELGREFWTSHYLSIRPHVGLRVALIEQSFDIQHKGGNWNTIGPGTGSFNWGAQTALNNEVHLDNDFKGVGLRSGLDTNWNLGCGWSIYGDLAASIIYGRFDIDHDEWNRLAVDNHTKIKVHETEESFRASRAILDLGLGLQWMGMVCDCKYGLTIALGWEQHLFFHQNQLWRVVRKNDKGNAPMGTVADNAPNCTGENVFIQRRGDLDTQGIALKAKFDF